MFLQTLCLAVEMKSNLGGGSHVPMGNSLGK